MADQICPDCKDQKQACCQSAGQGSSGSCCGGVASGRWKTAVWLLLLALVVFIIVHALVSDGQVADEGDTDAAPAGAAEVSQ